MNDFEIKLLDGLRAFDKATVLELMRSNEDLLNAPGYEVTEMIHGYVQNEYILQIEEDKMYYSITEKGRSFLEQAKAEKQRQTEEKRIADEKLRRKRKAKIIVSISAFCGIVAFIIVLITIIIPKSKYDEAVQLMTVGKYEQAIKVFSQIEKHKDAKKKIEECNIGILENKYQQALQLMENAEYEQAVEEFKKLQYKDSADKSAECLYLKQLSKMKDVNAGDVFSFGAYEQDNEPSNGVEEIEWIVLERDGDKIFAVSRYLIGFRQYDVGGLGVWKTCSLRQWLNGGFYRTAFNLYHRERILLSPVEAHLNTQMDSHTIDWFGEVSSGKDTEDYVFLLSEKEVREYQDFVEGAKVAWKVYRDVDSYDTTNNWWLRTPGYAGYHYVTTAEGRDDWFEIDAGGTRSLATESKGVRPAMWIDLSEMD